MCELTKLSPLIVNMFTWTTIQSLLNPRLGKSAHAVFPESASTLYKFHVPVGSLVCDTPINTADEVVCALATVAKIHRLLNGSYSSLGSNGLGLPRLDQ